MAYDPLSRSTRSARMTFMIVGASSVAASAFDIQLKGIESLQIPFPDQTMTIVLGVATAYLFIAFLVAYIDDFRWMAAMTVITIPLVLLIRMPPRAAPPALEPAK